MKEYKQKICKMPKCYKEVCESKKLFCGEHDREFQEFKNNAGNVAKGTLALAIVFIANKFIKKK